MIDKTMIPQRPKKDQGVTIAIAVVSVVVLILIIVIICMAVRKPSPTTLVDQKQVEQAVQKLKNSYQMSAAKEQKKGTSNPKQTLYRSNFSSVLPGSVTVKHGDSWVTTSQDLRPYLSPGDPIKIGPQIFQVGPQDKFTATTLPLSTVGKWIDETGGQHNVGDKAGMLLGPNATNVSVYTPVWVALNNYQWGGPNGGAIGYWKHFTWVPGSCPGTCPQWYSPLWLGPKGKQMTIDINDGPGCDGDYCPQEAQHLVRLQEPNETQGPIMQFQVKQTQQQQPHQQQQQPGMRNITSNDPLPSMDNLSQQSPPKYHIWDMQQDQSQHQQQPVFNFPNTGMRNVLSNDPIPVPLPFIKTTNNPMDNLYQVQHTELIQEPLASLPKPDYQPRNMQPQIQPREQPQALQPLNDGFTPLNRMQFDTNVGELLGDAPNLIHQSTKMPDNNVLGDAMWNRQETIGVGGLFPTSANKIAMNTRGASPNGIIQ
ncbi:MAG: hypothetical protein K0U52_03250 [Gammaproteobacteria bacterium]|nr:hypothetical protein [Gammaproteobacteria bacterium]